MKGTAFRIDKLRQLQVSPNLVEYFALDAEVGKQRASLEYYVLRQPLGGGTLAARLLPQDLLALQREVLRIARSIEITRRLD